MAEDLQPKLPTPRGPVIHSIVQAQRLTPICDTVESEVKHQVEDALRAMSEHLGIISRRACVQAYTAGLQDGFQQGCIAEAKSHE